MLSPSPAQKPPDPAQLISLPEEKREMVSDGIRTRQKKQKNTAENDHGNDLDFSILIKTSELTLLSKATYK